MKGIILAGGSGSRLWPLTQVTNKHLLPIGSVPMIEYPLNTILQTNPSSISVVTGGEHFQNIANYLGTCHKEIDFSYHYQKSAGGIAQALSLVGPFVKEEKLAVILGDNIFEDNFGDIAKKFENSGFGAMLFLKEVDNPNRFGVAEVKGKKIISLEEKPKNPKSNLAVTGVYLYDESVFEKIKKLKPSARGELEVTDLNNLYLEEDGLGYCCLKGFWSDAGTHESLSGCSSVIHKTGLDKKIYETLSRS